MPVHPSSKQTMPKHSDPKAIKAKDISKLQMTVHPGFTATDKLRDKVKSYCKIKGITRKEFTTMIDCSPSTFSRFMSGKIHGVVCPGNKSVAASKIRKFFR